MNYQIKSGDSLYEIASKHHITVEDILLLNPHIDPYRLVIGEFIMIPVPNKNNMGKGTLKEKMRVVWEQHVSWTRIVIISIIDHLDDEKFATNRLLRNAKDLANLYEPYYGKNVADTIEKLITDHLVIASKLVHALVETKPDEAEKLNTEWYKNADDIASALSGINPHYNKEAIKKMLYEHLDLTKAEAMNRLNRQYEKEINTFDMIEKQAIMMGDYFTEGINKQFHN